MRALAALPLRCWRGELPFATTYWLWGVGGNIGFALLLWRMVMEASRGRRNRRRPWLVYGVSVLWFVFVFGAIWRSSGRYRGSPLWKGLARLGVLSGIVRMTVELALVAVAAGARSEF
jgi:hypothetical protein